MRIDHRILEMEANGVDLSEEAHDGYPLVMTNIAIEMAIEIVDLPIRNCDFP